MAGIEYVVSACLLGVRCRYDGKASTSEKLMRQYFVGNIIPVCPEILGGLHIPRGKCEICRDGSGDIFKILTEDGIDLTEAFLLGAEKTLAIAKAAGATKAILKSRSPSCGKGYVYDGTFSGKLIAGDGITAALLENNNISVISEEDIGDLLT